MEQYRKLEEAEDGWEKFYESLGRKSRSHNWTVADKTENKKFNRYLNVKPFDHTRVKLEKLLDSDYINASYVTVPKAARKYILTQGPLPETISHFWLMVWEQKSSVIVMLNKVVEAEGFIRCEMYWPDNPKKPLELDDVNLKITLKETKNNKHYCVRKFFIKDLSADADEDAEREVLHFHYTDWPDYGSPDSPMSFLRLLAAVRKSGGLDKMDEPSVVHCLAGVGRSGTFCLIDSVLTLVENQGTAEGIDIESLLIEMRDHRPGLIQSSSQLKFSYTTILYGINILEKANKLHPHMSPYNPPSTPSTLTGASTGSGSAGAPLQSFQSTRFEFPPPEAPLGEAASTSVPSSASLLKGTSIALSKKPRRAATKKKQTATTSASTVNIFNQHLLVNALDDVDSDTADDLFYKTMHDTSSVKKARSDSAEDDMAKTPTNNPADLSRLIRSSVAGVGVDPSFVFPAALPRSDTPDSTILRRREREFRTKKLADKIDEIKGREKREEYQRERSSKRLLYLNRALIASGMITILTAAVWFYLLPSISFF